jgi:hypothetical protein
MRSFLLAGGIMLAQYGYGYQPPTYYQPPAQTYQGPVYAVPPDGAIGGTRQFLQVPQAPQHSTIGCFPNCY